MAAKKTPRLKVFATRIGIRDWLVAAPSQKAALAAWDVRENLFASGAAWVVDNPEAIAAALKSPGVPVPAPGQASVRIDGSDNVISLEARRKSRAASAPPPPPAPAAKTKLQRDRSRLDAAEAALAKHEREAKARRAAMEKRRRLLEDEAEALDAELVRQRRVLENKVEKARRDYEKA